MSLHLDIDIRLPLDRFELTVEESLERTTTGIFGPSGAGKSSLLEILCGLRRGAEGRIQVGEETWLDSAAGTFIPPERRRVGYVPQAGLLFPHWNVRRNLLAGSHRARGNPAELLARVASLLELAPLLDRSVAHLSGGERQRVALGRALCSAPRLLLLDEPLAALDLPLRRRLLPYLRRLRNELEVPMLLVTHDPIEAQALCDELVVLREGAVLARGEPRRVLTDPAVFSMAREQGFENVLAGTVLKHHGGTTEVRLGEPGVTLQVSRLESAVGSEVLVGLPASEILLANEKPKGLSARNILPATVREIRPLGHRALLTAELAAETTSATAIPVTVELVETTPERLGLRTGARVFLIVKATSCRVYGLTSRKSTGATASGALGVEPEGDSVRS